MAKFSKVDYTHIAGILRKHSTGYPADGSLPDDEYFSQLVLETLVDDLTEYYLADNRLFDENRFRTEALGYLKDVGGNEEEEGGD